MQNVSRTIRRAGNKVLKTILPGRWFYIIPYIFFPKRTALIYGELQYNEDNLATSHNSDFMKKDAFQRAYQVAVDATHPVYPDIRWRLHVLFWAASQVKKLPGDFIECGVWRGFLSRAVMEYVDFASLPKHFYLMDTYRGLVPEYISQAEKQHGIDQIHYDDTYEAVKATFKDFPNVNIVQGPIPETLPLVNTDQVCYLHIDMNNVKPEIAAAEYFWPKIVSGGVMILDDYGFMSHIEQKRAFDQFAQEHGIQILSLPTGQGLIIKL
jgi:Macrocin-O-methyltransferase (TylF)